MIIGTQAVESRSLQFALKRTNLATSDAQVKPFLVTHLDIGPRPPAIPRATCYRYIIQILAHIGVILVEHGHHYKRKVNDVPRAVPASP